MRRRSASACARWAKKPAGPMWKPTSSRSQAPPPRWEIWSTGSASNTNKSTRIDAQVEVTQIKAHSVQAVCLFCLLCCVDFQVKVKLLLAVEGADGFSFGLVPFELRPELVIHL